MAIKKSFLQLCVALGVTLATFQGAEVSGQSFFNKIFGSGAEEAEAEAEAEVAEGAEPASTATSEPQEQSAELEEAKKDTITSLTGLYEALIKKGFPIKERPEGEVTQILFYLRSMRGIIEDINLRGVDINARLAKLSNETVAVKTSDEFSPNNFLINLKKVRDNKPAVMAELLEIKKEILVIRGMLDQAEEYGLAMIKAIEAFWNTVKDPLILARYPFDKQMRNEVKEIKGILQELEPMVKSIISMTQNLSKVMIEATRMFTGMKIPDPDTSDLDGKINEAFDKIFNRAATETKD